MAVASGPISASRLRGLTNRLNSGVAIAVAAAVDASTSPVATGPPPTLAAYGAAMPCGSVEKTTSQPSSTRVRSARSPNTSRSPAAARASGEPRPASSRAAAGLARVPSRTSRPETTNVAASMSSEGRTPKKVTAAPPAAAPPTSAVRYVVCITAVPSA